METCKRERFMAAIEVLVVVAILATFVYASATAKNRLASNPADQQKGEQK